MTRGYSLVMSIFLKEVQVHSSIPPLVSGKVRGHLMVGIDGGVEWKHSVGPPAPKLFDYLGGARKVKLQSLGNHRKMYQFCCS